MDGVDPKAIRKAEKLREKTLKEEWRHMDARHAAIKRRRPTTGLVAFFDILGYQAIIDNNEVEAVANIVTDIIESLPKATDKVLAKGLKGHEDRFANHIVDCRIISDSILLSCTVEGDFGIENGQLGVADWDRFLKFELYCCHLMMLSFDAGLPLRGAVSFGKYYASNNSFAGKPIIDCFRLGSRLDLSACVIHPTGELAMRQLFSALNSDGQYRDMTRFAYSVPMNDGTSERMYVLNWALLKEPSQQPSDKRAYVIESFQRYNKDITPEVISKVDNTEMLLRRAWSVE